MEERKEEQMQGISTSIGKETVMDVEIKDEYKKGWFGNAKLGGGAALSGDKGNPLKKGAKGLYEGNVMLSGYGEKDQTVLIASAFNTATSDAGNTSAAIQEDDFASIGGLMSAVHAGEPAVRAEEKIHIQFRRTVRNEPEPQLSGIVTTTRH